MSMRASRAALPVLLSFTGALAFAQSTAIQPLSGMGEAGEAEVKWDFHLDAGRGSGQWTKIRVPSVWEQEGYGSYFYGVTARGKPDADSIVPRERGAYRTEFTVPAKERGTNVRIVFGGVMTDAHVSINGKPVGEHRGGFYQFEFDITEHVRVGRNTLELVVDKESSEPSVNRAERRGDYWTFGGIFRPVWLEYKPAEHIERVAIDARADGSVNADIFVSTGAKQPRRVLMHIHDRSDRPIASSTPIALRSGDRRSSVRVSVENPQLWTAETPYLYHARFELQTQRAGKWRTVHETRERFGMRTFEVRPGQGLYLNGQRIILKGVNRHSFSPRTGRTLTREESYRDVRLMKKANLNAVRMSHYPPDKHFLEVADELGLYVIDELAGWQGAYDAHVGAPLIGELIRRDVNHPSVLFWANGNEGGWNTQNDDEFAKWDPQRRPVLHPWAIFSSINTDHYESYDSTVKLTNGPDIFMPTEFLHALYDGGAGAGLKDYWDVMRSGPHPAGGFIWAWMDEGIERTDQDGRIDNQGALAPDGIVSPYREKEGSYFAVKEIWSPVQVRDLRLDGASLRMQIENRYDFIALNDCRFRWRVVRLPRAANWRQSEMQIATGEVAGPALTPGKTSEWSIEIDSASLDQATHVYLTAIDQHEREVWTWSAAVGDREVLTNFEQGPEASSARGADTSIKVGKFELTFNPATGELQRLLHDGIEQSFGGPKSVAYRRVDAQFVPTNDAPSRLKQIETFEGQSDGIVARIAYEGLLREVIWRVTDDALVLDYELAPNGTFDLLGIAFDVPEKTVRAKRWLGNGPYHVWQNRLEGGTVGIHQNELNDPIPGQTYQYPEFKGYFSEWRWFAMQTTFGNIVAENASEIPYVGVFAPHGGEKPLLQVPDTGWSFLHVIPAMASKFKAPPDLGPQSQPATLNTPIRGRVKFTFEKH